MDAADDDVGLMLAFQNGDESAFDALFERWAGRLLHFLDRMVRDRALAEDLVQESFLRVHRARERYRPQARFSTWLFTIAGNAARNELRRPARRSPHEPADAAGSGAALLRSPAPAPDVVAHARAVGDRVDAALAGLPERQRAALWLRAVEGLSYAEIAEALDTTPKSVKALVHRARAGLADRMGDAEAGAGHEDPAAGEAPARAGGLATARGGFTR